jgi:signal transduction histidine kinase
VFKRFDIRLAINQILESFSLHASVRMIQFQVNWQGVIPTSMTNDKTRLQQILRNLVQNAMNYTNTSITVDICFLAPAGELQIVVTDDGAGIPAKIVKEIYAQNKKQRKDRRYALSGYHGIGLGLSISLLLAKKMGGELSLRTLVGKKTTFKLVIPCIECA